MHPVVDPLILIFFFLIILAILVYEHPRLQK
jgi:hypothetical protein